MDDETTTDAPVESGGQSINGVPIDDQGQAIPLPEETTEETPMVEVPGESDQEQAEETTEEPGGDEPQPETDEPDAKLQKFAKSQGLELDSPNAIKAARIAMKTMGDNTRDYQRSAEIEKATKITEDQIDPTATLEQRDNIRVRNLEIRYEAQDWKLRNPDKLAYENEMGRILQEDPQKRLLVQEGMLSFDDVYAIARGRSTDEDSIKSQGGRQALEKLAQKQQAASPRGNATNSSQLSSTNKITPQNVDQVVGRMSPEEYRRRLPEINRAMAG